MNQALQIKSFRLPSHLVQFLANKSAQMKTSQTAILEKALEEMMGREDQWKYDLCLMSQDETYNAEQVSLAEENYED